MNKNAIKTFAIWARNELINRVTQKAFEYGVSKDNIIDANSDSINGRLLTNEEKNQRIQLIGEIKNKGFEQVIEEVSYTWFNRFIALRYMEVNNYLPNRIRVFTDENNEFKPQILTEAINLEIKGLDKQLIFEYIDNNKQDELYKYLLLTICNDMNTYLPDMFTTIDDYKALLMPDHLLNEGSVLDRLIKDISEEDWTDQVQIIGWLYQYYIQMPKDELIHAKKQYKNGDVPFVTQLFTPDWIVRYMVQNSLGNLFAKMYPENKEIKKWDFFMLDNSTHFERKNAKDIKLLDPCMGSGHILVYAFDILLEFYREEGYSDREAVVSILENNLYGFDIDERAYQLAYFAVMMKARSYNRRILQMNIHPNLFCIKDVYVPDSLINEIEKNISNKQLLRQLLSIYKNGHVLGSLVDISNLDNNEIDKLYCELEKYDDKDNLFGFINIEYINNDLIPIIRITQILKQEYDFVVTNPPYINSSLMPKEMKTFVNNSYEDVKSDIFAVFIKKCIQLTKKEGYVGMITPYVWMFISSYEKLRNYVLNNVNISTLVQLEYNAFPAACVPVATFVFKKTEEKYPGKYIKLSDFKGSENQAPKTIEAIQNNNCGYYYETKEDNFEKIPGSPIAYWASNSIVQNFSKGIPLEKLGKTTKGLITGNNALFLRNWWEIDQQKIDYYCESSEQSLVSGYEWFPCNKGGDRRKWYGNQDFVINWIDDGKNLFDAAKKNDNHAQNYYSYLKFKEGISWSSISSGGSSFRYRKNELIDHAGMGFYSLDNKIKKYLGLMNSKVSELLLSVLSPTLNYNAGEIDKIPVLEAVFDISNNKIDECIQISQSDWDSYETSWDFKVNPMIKYKSILSDSDACSSKISGYYGRDIDIKSPIEMCYYLWKIECNERFKQLKANEEELNRIFIDIYGLQDELTPEESDKDVTVHYVVDRKEDIPESLSGSNYVRTKDDEIKSFISYAVGCMFGRYSLDYEGLAYAGGQWDDSKYVSYKPDSNNIIPICDDDYFDDDIVGKFIRFVEVVYGKESLEANLQFIADSLGGTGSAREIIRNYFLNDFFKDHCNTYQVTGSGKRPIYWLFDSGKKNGFKALIYIHRYTPDLIARMRTQYIHEQQSRYRNQIEFIEKQLDGDITSSERVQLTKQLKKFKEQDEELRVYEEKIHHWADKMEPMDLDDGVKANYAKFQDLLAKIK